MHHLAFVVVAVAVVAFLVAVGLRHELEIVPTNNTATIEQESGRSVGTNEVK